MLSQRCFASQPLSAQHFWSQLLHSQAQAAASAARPQQMQRSRSESRTPRLRPDARNRVGLKTLRAACGEHRHCHHQKDAGGWGRIYPAPFAWDRGSPKTKPWQPKTADRKSGRESVKSDTTILSVDKQSKQKNSCSIATASLSKHGRIKC